MRSFTQHQGLVAPLDRSNVDTDSIIPKQFLKGVTKTGYGPFLFDDWRYNDAGGTPGQDCSDRPLNPNFVLNQPRYQGASILLTRENFGCGSSREHAAWALVDAGFHAVIAVSFAEIFYSNAIKNGLLPVALDSSIVERLFQAGSAQGGYCLSIDLEAYRITDAGGEEFIFDVAEDVRHRLLHGLDDIGLTLQHHDAISVFESRRAEHLPWLFR